MKLTIISGEIEIEENGRARISATLFTRDDHYTPRFGRPLAKDAHKTLAATKPWEAEGVSRRTWYRQRGGK